MTEPETGTAPAPDPAFDRAFALHRAGRAGEAFAAYQAVLAEDPKHLGALTYSAVILLEQGKAEDAVARLQEALVLAPADAAASAYLANGLQVLGRLEEAEAAYRKALEAAPDDPRSLNNYGILLRRLRRPEEAERAFRQAIELQPDYGDALRNHGAALLALGRGDEALAAFEQALRLDPKDARAHHAKGRCLKELGRPEAAIPAYEAALALVPSDHGARHNLGVALKLAGRPKDAIACYREVLRQRPERAMTHFNLANTLLDVGEVDAAIEAYKAAIAQRPDHLEAHKALNDLYWQQGRAADYASSYREAIRQAPESVALRQQHARQLELVDRLDEAEQAMQAAIRDLGAQPAFSHRLGIIAGRRDQTGEAAAHFDTAVALAPEETPYRLDYTVLLLTSGDYEGAATQLDAWEGLSPDDQGLWAYRGLLWRLTEDPRADWLYDLERFVRPLPLATPPGHDSLQSFLEVLGEELTALHPDAAHPLEQSLRGGTQTPGDLFNRPAPLIQALKTEIERCIGCYIDELPDDPRHPLLRRKTGRFAFSGSWSVRLTAAGFHVDHVHPKGWISSACYIALPDSLKGAPTGDDKAGWIRFGQSPHSLGPRDAATKWVRPQEGLLVLFPSYLWHGTEAFEGEAVRMTVAFDAVPA